MRLFHTAAALLGSAALISGAAAARKHYTRLPEGTPVLIVGQVSSNPKSSVDEQKMQVAIGPEEVDYTLHLNRATVFKGPNGEWIDEDRFQDGHWVRAEGRVMNDPRRIMVSRIRLITTRKAPTLSGNPYNRRGYAKGYLVWPYGEASRVAGSRAVYRRAQ